MSAAVRHLADGPLGPPVRAALRGWLRLDVTGADHCPREGGLLVAATHASHADSPALGAALPRPLLFLGASQLARTPVLGALLPALGLLPVERGEADADLLGLLADQVRDGAALVVYPEGSRSRDGRVHRPRSGLARLAAMTGAPVLPVGIDGTGAAWPVDGRPRLRSPRTVTVRVGQPLAAPLDAPRDRRAWSSTLHDALVELSGRPRAEGLAPVGGAT